MQIADTILLRLDARLVFLRLSERLVETGLRRGVARDKAANALHVERYAAAVPRRAAASVTKGTNTPE